MLIKDDINPLLIIRVKNRLLEVFVGKVGVSLTDTKKAIEIGSVGFVTGLVNRAMLVWLR